MEKRVRKPDWLKIKLPEGRRYRDVKRVVTDNKLHTICSSGRCPNMGECWGEGTATFMIAGDICTRSCKFCATASGKPNPIDSAESTKIAESVKLMSLKHCVITSVDRDDLSDGGAKHWANTISEVKRVNPNTTMEVLIPDFDGDRDLIEIVTKANPNIISHNLETVEHLTPKIRSRAKYRLSLEVIKTIHNLGVVTKSGIMLGLGEKREEILQTMDDLIEVGCEIFTLGQYLQPTKNHIPVVEYIHPDTFAEYKEIAIKKGFRVVESGPLVRSSYRAERHI